MAATPIAAASVLGFQRFVADCFALPKPHELADPLSGLCLNVIAPCLAHPWHFDTNEFTVSLLTQQARDGGVFEYCPNIRSADAENLDDVAAVLAGRGEHLVRHSSCAPATCDCSAVGSLCTMAPLCGDQARHTAIFAYSECAGVIDSAERTRQLFGRILPEHAEGEGRAVCVDHLLD